MANDTSTASGYAENGCKVNTKFWKTKSSHRYFLVFNNLFGFCMAGVAHEKEQKVCGFLLFKIEGEGNYLAA